MEPAGNVCDLVRKPYSMKNCEITVYGLVQGIGYRPFVAEMAEKLDIHGNVRNAGGVVIVIARGEDGKVEELIEALRCKAPAGARIDQITVDEISESDFNEKTYAANSFRIVESDDHTEELVLLPPDLPTCPECERDLFDSKNRRRYHYPFNSCVKCGPRYSIMHSIPYDRENTTMEGFLICDACREEYGARGDVRRHAQTIACAECGPQLRLVGSDHNEMAHEDWGGTVRKNPEQYKYRKENIKQLIGRHGQLIGDMALTTGIRELKAGAVVAVKDIGGFHLAFLPTDSEPGRRVREFKKRDNKPFAVMFPSVESIREYCEVSAKEEEILLSDPRPIVLLRKKPGMDFVPEVCGRSDRIGCMLPCNPLQILLLKEVGPLVMTSGNRGGEPIIIRDEDMMKYINRGCPDFMLTHDREILTPLDDSIYQVTKSQMEDGTVREIVQIIRRARGLVPEPVILRDRLVPQDLFAAGGDLKNTFALARGRAVYLSAHFGDLVDLDAAKARMKAIHHMEALFRLTPEWAVADKHPNYISTRAAEDSFGSKNVDKVQHHHAHVLSVIAEHGLRGKVLGLAFDGTGFGDDGTVWGSEFLLCDAEHPSSYRRLGHLRTVKALGADEASKNAKLMAACYMYDAVDRHLISEDVDQDEILDPEKHQMVNIALKADFNTFRTSSMSRLFDAAAVILRICEHNSYEGECPIMLEKAASEAAAKLEREEYPKDLLDRINSRAKLRFVLEKENGVWTADASRMIADLRMAKDALIPPDELALEFHAAVVDMIVRITENICRDLREEGEVIRTIALAGGTFLNRIILSHAVAELTNRGYDVYVNEKVPSGDGGLPLGQVYALTK